RLFFYGVIVCAGQIPPWAVFRSFQPGFGLWRRRVYCGLVAMGVLFFAHCIFWGRIHASLCQAVRATHRARKKRLLCKAANAEKTGRIAYRSLAINRAVSMM